MEDARRIGRGRVGTGGRGAFTLLELIVVITIIGILGTLVVVKVQGWGGKTKEPRIRADLKAIIQAAEYYHLQFGTYPTSIEEMKTGAKGPSGEDFNSPIENSKDPWNNEYLFETGPDGKPLVRCLGQDGVEGGEGDNKDFQY